MEPILLLLLCNNLRSAHTYSANRYVGFCIPDIKPLQGSNA